MNLTNYGVQELNAQEITKIEGGFWSYLVAAAAFFLYETAGNPEASSDAFWDGFYSTQ